MASLPLRMSAPATKPHASVARVDRGWYVVARSADVRGRPVSVTLLGVPLVVFRGASGAPGALLDRCPHRNVPLSTGKVEGEHLVCGYHGWEFNKHGECCGIPGLCGGAEVQRGRRVAAWPTVEQDGWIWVWAAPEVAPVGLPFSMAARPGYTEARRVVTAPGTLHATLENALDVPHTAFLHGGLFRTAKNRNKIEGIVRRFHDRVECEYVGEPRPSGLIGRLLSPSGAVVQHWDRFFLPSIAQVEYRIGEEVHVLVTAAGSPVSDFETKLFALVQFKTRLPGKFLKLLLEPFGRALFLQDRRMLGLQTATIQRFGGEQFESTEIDLLGPHIWRLLREAERGSLAENRDEPNFEKRVTFMA